MGHNPSFVWQSLLSVRDVIVAGSKWKIGDGECIGVTTHKWLSHGPIFNGEPDPELKVSDLIDVDTRQWDRGEVHALFTAKIQNEILALLLNDTHARDSLIWMENKSRTFSVKIAYHIALPAEAAASTGALKGPDKQANLEETLDTKCTPKS